MNDILLKIGSGWLILMIVTVIFSVVGKETKEEMVQRFIFVQSLGLPVIFILWGFM